MASPHARFLTPEVKSSLDKLKRHTGQKRWRELAQLVGDSPLYQLLRKEVQALGEPFEAAREADVIQFSLGAWFLLMSRLSPDAVERGGNSIREILRSKAQGPVCPSETWDALGDFAKHLEPLLTALHKDPRKRDDPRRLSLGSLLIDLLFHSPFLSDDIKKQAEKAQQIAVNGAEKFIGDHLAGPYDNGTLLILASQTVILLRNCGSHPGERLRECITASNLTPTAAIRLLLGLTAWLAVRALSISDSLHLPIQQELWMPSMGRSAQKGHTSSRTRTAKTTPDKPRETARWWYRLAIVVLGTALLLTAILAWHPRDADPPIARPSLEEWTRTNQDYESLCSAEQDKMVARKASGDLREFRVAVRLAEGAPPKDHERVLTDEDVADRLVSGGFERTLILGPAGSGKSVLAHVIRALACKRMPTFLLELDVLTATVDTGRIDLLECAAKHAARITGEDEASQFLQLLQHESWILILDGLDEIPETQRDRVILAANELMARYRGSIRVVLTGRPPVFGLRDYGLKTDTELDLLPLSCSEADAVVTQIVTDDAERKRFREFLTRYGFDRTQPGIDGCHYLLMTTYREVHVVIEAFRSGLAAGTPTKAQMFQMYAETVLGFQLKLQGTNVSELLPLIDRMTIEALTKGEAYGRAMRFTAQDCTHAFDADVPAHERSSAQREQPTFLCERLLSSGIFEEAQESDSTLRRRFKDESLADLFVARAIDSRIRNDGTGACSRLGEMPRLFQTSDVAAFLVGLPAGHKCFPELLHTLCEQSSNPEELARQFRQGLPWGDARQHALERALAVLVPQAGECAALVLTAVRE